MDHIYLPEMEPGRRFTGSGPGPGHVLTGPPGLGRVRITFFHRITESGPATDHFFHRVSGYRFWQK
jgi:hypothetical protein